MSLLGSQPSTGFPSCSEQRAKSFPWSTGHIWLTNHPMKLMASSSIFSALLILLQPCFILSLSKYSPSAIMCQAFYILELQQGARAYPCLLFFLIYTKAHCWFLLFSLPGTLIFYVTRFFTFFRYLLKYHLTEKA